MVGQPFPKTEWAPDLISPVQNLLSVTPSDSADIQINGADGVGRALYVGGTGDVAIHDIDGNLVTIVALAAGIWHPVRVRRVLNTNTSATDILIGY